MMTLLKPFLFLALAALMIAACKAPSGKDHSHGYDVPPAASEPFAQSAERIRGIEQICHPPQNWLSFYNKHRGTVFSFGERHGTKDSPAMVVGYACAIAMLSEQSTVLLYEIDRPQSDRFDVFNAREIPEDDIRSWILKNFHRFFNQGGDGRKSEAVLNSMIAAYNYGRDGIKLDIGSFCFTDAQEAQAEGHVSLKAMFEQEALNVVTAREHYSNVVVLTGNRHMLRHRAVLSQKGLQDKMVGIFHIYSGGEEYNCQQGSCGVHPSVDHPYASQVAPVDDFSIIERPGVIDNIDHFYYTARNIPSPPAQ